MTYEELKEEFLKLSVYEVYELVAEYCNYHKIDYTWFGDQDRDYETEKFLKLFLATKD